MNNRQYSKPEATIYDFSSKYGFMQDVDPGIQTSQALGNSHSKTFEDEEDDQQSTYYNEFWDDEEE